MVARVSLIAFGDMLLELQNSNVEELLMRLNGNWYPKATPAEKEEELLTWKEIGVSLAPPHFPHLKAAVFRGKTEFSSMKSVQEMVKALDTRNVVRFEKG